MYTLRCTAKLLRRLGPPSQGASEPPSNLLGDWYATLVHAPRMQLVLMVSERSLLPILVPAREAATLTERSPGALAEVLLRLGVLPSVIEREVAAMAQATIGRTANRRVLGSMNDFVAMMRSHPWPPPSLTALSIWLAAAPCGPIGMASPDDLTRELLADPARSRASPPRSCRR
ncbi:MAG: hypothetical protein U0229_24915 [Anaeromyxobacter sp.]